MSLFYKIKTNIKLNSLFTNNLEIKFILLICTIISLFLVLALKSNIIFHTDTIAPIQQVKLFINSNDVKFSEIRFARIPSLLPDILIIYTLVKFFNISDNYTIIASYSFINSFLLLAGFSLILDYIFKERKLFLLSTFIMLSSNLYLVLNNFFYREIYGHFLTPLHQGGNIIMTLYSFLFLLYNIQDKQLKIFYFRINYFLIPIIIGLSIVSNKLYIFTFVFPLIIIIMIYYVSKNILCFKLNFNLISKDFFNRIIYKKLFIFVSIPLFLISNLLIKLLNTQPIPNINIKVFSTIDGLEMILNRSFLFIVITIIYISLFALSFFLLKINDFSVSNKFYNIPIINNNSFQLREYSSDLYITTLFISILGLTPFVYIWFAENVISRYFLINYLFAPLAFSILLVLNLNHFFIISNKINRLIFPFFTFLFVISFVFLFFKSITYYQGSNYTYSSWPVRNSIKDKIDYNFINRFNLSYSLRQAALISRSDFAVDHEQIHSLGLTNGLSDYWGSSVFFIGPHYMKISPITSLGKPNLWANSKYDYKVKDSNQTINYNFVYTRDYDFAYSIIKSYGNPDFIYQLQHEISKPKLITLDQLNETSNNILIYTKNSLGWENIQQSIKN
tara:strand:- start:1742 stop:3598 length:1857 start_codon:yes stop_codon:yes gene_type:complete